MPARRPSLLGLMAGLAFAVFSVPAAANGPASPASDWPDTVVRFEDLRPLSSFRLVAPHNVREGRVTGPAVLRAHIGPDGNVARVALLESSGNPDLDEASLHGMRAMQFRPYTFGGTPIAVTLVAPVHVPPQWGRSRR